MDINESPVYVLLNPSINHAQKDLPVTIYESGTYIVNMGIALWQISEIYMPTFIGRSLSCDTLLE